MPTFRLNEAVKRNLDRFPEDFMFQLNSEETKSLASQLAMSKEGAGAPHPTICLYRTWRSAARVEKLEAAQKKHGSIIGILAEEIDEMKRPPEPPKRRIGFKTSP